MCGTAGRSTTATATANPNEQNNTMDNLPLIDLEFGDPMVFESYWKRMGEKCKMVISGCDFMSYLSDESKVCWFLLPELEDAIGRLHGLVGNVVLENRHIVVGNGSTQLFQAALYALASTWATPAPHTINVVSAAPFYSAYPEETDYLCSRLYKWGGDANEFDGKSGPFIEVVNSPNNPDGSVREAVVKGYGDGQGKLIHDLAYYWPQYTPITRPADHDIMYFTFSKCTGHAGSRIGWALVKDIEVARKMTRCIELNSLGVSKDSQLRAAKIMEVICDDYQKFGSNYSHNFFDYGQRLMAKRWKSLRDVTECSDVLSLPAFPEQHCCFFQQISQSYPAFAWLKCREEIEDYESFLRGYKIQGRHGRRFGADAKYVRISMLSSDDVFNQLLERLSTIKSH